MIRWYDWLLAISLADLIQSFLFAGFSSVVWWEPILYGGAAGYMFRLWVDIYCQFRLKFERDHGQ